VLPDTYPNNDFLSALKRLAPYGSARGTIELALGPRPVSFRVRRGRARRQSDLRWTCSTRLGTDLSGSR
jgi:hypothetical protein